MEPMGSGSVSGNPLNADFGRINTAAVHVDDANAEITTLLRNIADSVESLGGAAWSGSAYLRFKQIMGDWQDQSLKLNTALAGIADSLRTNSKQLDTSEQDVAATIERAGAAAGPLNMP